MDKAILVGLNIYQDEQSVLKSLDELEHLALALGIKTKDKVCQNAKKITAKYYIGSGKVLEIKKMIEILDIDIVIFDDTLSPAQLKNLEKDLDVQVIDRSFLIMSIFAIRAQTKEAKLEVSLAQKYYSLPRLIGLGNSLSRQGGGTYNAKGPGETKLELDRRKILREIGQIQDELEKINEFIRTLNMDIDINTLIETVLKESYIIEGVETATLIALDMGTTAGNFIIDAIKVVKK